MNRPVTKRIPERWAYVLFDKEKVVGVALSERLAWAWRRVDMKYRVFEKIELIRFCKYPQFQRHPAKDCDKLLHEKYKDEGK